MQGKSQKAFRPLGTPLRLYKSLVGLAPEVHRLLRLTFQGVLPLKSNRTHTFI